MMNVFDPEEARDDAVLGSAARLAYQSAHGESDPQTLHDEASRIIPTTKARGTPIELMRTQPKSPLLDWEYEAALRFRADFEAMQRPSCGVLNYERHGMFDTALTRGHRKAGYHGKGASRIASAGGISDARVSAIQRRSACLKAVGDVSFFLAEAVVGMDLKLADVAAHLNEDRSYVARRFREALHDLAGFYRIMVRGPRTGRVQAWHASN